jgi:hypothetical protein
VIDRDSMGQYHKDGDAVVQRIRMAGGGYARWRIETDTSFSPATTTFCAITR